MTPLKGTKFAELNKLLRRACDWARPAGKDGKEQPNETRLALIEPLLLEASVALKELLAQECPTSLYLEVTTHLYARHCWPEAPEKLAYLRSPHPHRFRITVRVPVTETDRELELHQLRAALGARFAQAHALGAGMVDLDHASCEQLALEIINGTLLDYPVVRVAVFEDDDHGAIAERN